MLKNIINSPNEETDTIMLVKAQGMCLLKRVKIKAEAVIIIFSGSLKVAYIMSCITKSFKPLMYLNVYSMKADTFFTRSLLPAYSWNQLELCV